MFKFPKNLGISALKNIDNNMENQKQIMDGWYSHWVKAVWEIKCKAKECTLKINLFLIKIAYICKKRNTAKRCGKGKERDHKQYTVLPEVPNV